ncbi:MAG: hypothetical protein V1835_00555 [Candidatus Micrarchaeota archaeon]
MKQAMFFLFCAIFLFGCLQIESKKPTPTPQIIYINASPQVIVTIKEVPTLVPTVTDRIVIPSVSIKPAPKGSVEDLGERVDYVQFDISKGANADYRHNPFIIHNSVGRNLFPSLSEGNIYWKKIPFNILPDYASSGIWNVITTAGEDFYSATFSANAERVTEIYLLLAASFRAGDQRELGEIRLNYADGDMQPSKIFSNQDVWNYNPDPEFAIPQDSIAWQTTENNLTQTLTIFNLTIGRRLAPIGGVTIKRTASGENGFTVFAATGLKRFQTRAVTHTQTEFQNLEYNRILVTTLPAGAMINYATEGGMRIYRPEGIFESPSFDGETEFVNWKEISWDSDTPMNTKLQIFVRTAQVDMPWSEWIEVQRNGDVPEDARYLQWKAVLKTTDSSMTPILKQIRLTYENPV